MGSRRSNRRSLKRKRASLHSDSGKEGTLLQGDLSFGEKGFEFFAIATLLAFGIYHSVLYFGHQPVPHFDFHCFTAVGREILSFDKPSGFKRLPLVGILQILLGSLTRAQSPDFVGGWLLNSLLHPLNAVLLWLVCRRIVGKAALWLAVILIINPWVLQLLTEAIVETTLLFGILITFYLIFRRSKWSYLAASLTTMVRYEGAALIMAAFIIDMIEAGSKKERIRAFIYSAAASIPLAIWMSATLLNWKQLGGTHYLKELGAASGGKFILVEYIRLIWKVGFFPLLIPPTRNTGEVVFNLSRILAAGSFIFGVSYGLYKRQWNILALLIFFVPYILAHALHSFMYARFCMPVAWMPVVICLYGLQGFWKLINKNNRIPRPIVLTLQVTVLIVTLCWIAALLPYLPKLNAASRRSVYLPYVGIGAVSLILAARILACRSRYLWRDIIVSAVTVLIIVSNQYALVQVVGNGTRDIEFKYLLDWYIANAKAGEKLALSAPVILQTMSPQRRDYFFHISDIGGDNPNEFVQNCYKQNITYVAWDSRTGFHPNNRYYKSWRMQNIAALAQPRNVGPYEFIGKVGGKSRFINIFRLHRPIATPQQR